MRCSKDRQRRPLLALIIIVALVLRVANSFSLDPSTNPAPRGWKPKIASIEERRLLRGQQHSSERIGTLGFHHIEFYCGDAKSMAYRFSLALGMPIVGETGQMTGNDQCVSYALQSGQVRLLFTAPYSQQMSSSSPNQPLKVSMEQSDDAQAPRPLPSFDVAQSHEFFAKHGFAAKAIGVQVKDAKAAFEASVKGGAKPILEPTFVPTCKGQLEQLPHKQQNGVSNTTGCMISEVGLYGDVSLRFISSLSDDSNKEAAISSADQQAPRMPFLPHLSPTRGYIANKPTYGIYKIDHAVGNVQNLLDTLEYIAGFTGFHEFAEFTAEDVGTVDSGLNSVVLASDSEDVLLPLNEPTQGKRKSQIQTYLEQNEGAGLQHLALKTHDIIDTIRKMKMAEEHFGGFELMKRPSDEYYRTLPDRLGNQLTPQQYEDIEELGILADADDEGLLLQIFTKPIGDRPTFFIEIIQRIGCEIEDNSSSSQGMAGEKPGCGGFGQGNFRELFRAIEEHEKTLRV